MKKYILCIGLLLPISTVPKFYIPKSKQYFKPYRKPAMRYPQKLNLPKKNSKTKIKVINLLNLANQLPKLAGPALQGGIIDMQSNKDNYSTKNTVNFNPSGVETLTGNNLVGHFKEATILDIPPRRMWGWGGDTLGYCGETSFQMCGIFFGNWVSSELIRYAANNEELLIGDTDLKNDIAAAKTLKYKYESFTNSNSNKFINWVKKHIDAGYPVLAGFYQYHTADEEADDDYDHIMPIIGYSVDTNNQINGFYFYDLYLKNYSLIKASTHAEFKKQAFQSRKQTHQLSTYKLPSIDGAPINENNPDLPDNTYAFTYALPKGMKYALAITGVQNKDEELLRTKLNVNRWHEPDWGAEDQKNEKSININLTATIYDLIPGKTYSILRFEPIIDKKNHIIDTKNIPTSNYATSPHKQKLTFKATAPVVKIDLGSVRSDGAYFYRTIKEHD